MEEVIAVARARNSILPEDVVEGAIKLIGSVAYHNKTSMLLDRKGRRGDGHYSWFLCKAGKIGRALHCMTKYTLN